MIGYDMDLHMHLTFSIKQLTVETILDQWLI